ncbi:hypothetical protein SAY87_002698 [Trapa incisa]|uniref:Uncharacterized protein n=1 Tax=Trapa incisa TaxID=236973 RepID=A0AAN7PVL4_9MYRT|nr:hypothetical protein SAY87_002698 [Trapa incisa]
MADEIPLESHYCLTAFASLQEYQSCTGKHVNRPKPIFIRENSPNMGREKLCQNSKHLGLWFHINRANREAYNQLLQGKGFFHKREEG